MLEWGFYGWFKWNKSQQMSNNSNIVTWRPAKHLVVVFFIVLTGLISGNLLREYTDAVLPNADSITTIGDYRSKLIWSTKKKF